MPCARSSLRLVALRWLNRHRDILQDTPDLPPLALLPLDERNCTNSDLCVCRRTYPGSRSSQALTLCVGICTMA